MTREPADSQNNSDEAMLNWLAGDEGVIAAASLLWNASGKVTGAAVQLRAARDELKTATRTFSEAILACRIPPEHAKRLGAALILRLARARLLAKIDDSTERRRASGTSPDQP